MPRRTLVLFAILFVLIIVTVVVITRDPYPVVEVITEVPLAE